MKFFIAIALSAGLFAQAQENAAPLVLQAFQNSCSTSGKWTEAALQQNRLMNGVLETLKSQDPCKPFVGKLAVIQSATTQIEGLLTDPAFADFRLAEEKLQNLMLELNVASTPELISALGQQAVSTQVNIAERRAIYQTQKDQDGRDRYEKATLSLSRYVQGLLTESGGLASCLKSSPGAAVQLSTNLLAMGGSFVSPIYGAAAAVIGQIANLGVEYFRTNQKEKEIYRLYSAQMPAALTCGLESMTALYCQANDAFSLLELQSKKRDPLKPLHPVWADLDVMRRQLPILDSWLQKVRNGVTPSNPTEADRQNEIWAKVQFLENTNRRVLGLLNYREQLYNSEPDPAEKFNLLVSFVVTLTRELTNERQSPILEYTSDGYKIACFLSRGLQGTCPSNLPDQTLEAYVQSNFATDLKDVTVLFLSWEQFFGAVDRRVANEFNQSIAMDPSAILASAFEVNKEKISSITATRTMIAFLDRLQSTTGPDKLQRKQLITETVSLLNEFLNIIQTPGAVDAKDQIRSIFKLFQLGQNVKFLRDRISDFVLWDLTDHLHAGNFPADAQEILISGAADIRTRLEASGVSRDSSEADLNGARAMASGNIEAFNSFFTASSGKTLETLWTKSKSSGEPAVGTNRPYGQSLARLCLLQLITRDVWPKNLNWQHCQEAVLYSIYRKDGEPLKLKLSEVKAKLVGMPLSARYCIYHDFIREGRVADMLKPDDGIFLRQLRRQKVGQSRP